MVERSFYSRRIFLARGLLLLVLLALLVALVPELVSELVPEGPAVRSLCNAEHLSTERHRLCLWVFHCLHQLPSSTAFPCGSTPSLPRKRWHVVDRTGLHDQRDGVQVERKTGWIISLAAGQADLEAPAQGGLPRARGGRCEQKRWSIFSLPFPCVCKRERFSGILRLRTKEMNCR